MTRRRPGRPALDATDPSVRVTLTLPAKRYDALYRAADDARVTVPELIRRSLGDELARRALGEYKSRK